MNSFYQFVSPLKYLDPYNYKDNKHFFGRDKEIRGIVRLFKKTNLVVIYGPSGSGKTSVVECGLSRENYDWKFITVRRNKDIIESFFNAFNKIFSENSEECLAIRKSFEDIYEYESTNKNTKAYSNKIIQEKRAVLKRVADELYEQILFTPFFIFDQFEELFALGNSKEIKKFSYLLFLLSANLTRANIALVIQTNFFANLLSLEYYNPNIIEHKFLVDDPTVTQTEEILDNIFEYFNINQYQSPVKDKLIEISHEKKIDRIKLIIHELQKFELKNTNEIESNSFDKIHLPYLQIYLNRIYLEDFFRTYQDKKEEYLVNRQNDFKEVLKIKSEINKKRGNRNQHKSSIKKIKGRIYDVYIDSLEDKLYPSNYYPLEFEKSEIRSFGNINKIVRRYIREVNRAVIKKNNEIVGKHDDIVAKFLKYFISDRNTSNPIEIDYQDRKLENIGLEDEFLKIKDSKLRDLMKSDLFPDLDIDINESLGDLIDELLKARILKKKGRFIELSQTLLIPIIKKIPVKKMIKEYYRMHFNSAFVLYTKEKDKKPLPEDRVKEYKKHIKDIIQNDPGDKKKAFWDMSVKYHKDIRLEEERKEKEREEEERRKEKERESKERRKNRKIFFGIIGGIFVIIFIYFLHEKRRSDYASDIFNSIDLASIDVTQSYIDLKKTMKKIESDKMPFLDSSDFPNGINHLKKLKTNFIAEPFYLKKLELPNSLGEFTITNHHIISTKSRYSNGHLFIFAQTKDILAEAKIEIPLKDEKDAEWRLISKGNSISSFIPIKVDNHWKLIFSDASGIYETDTSYTKSTKLSKFKGLKFLTRVGENNFVGQTKNNQSIIQFMIVSNNENKTIQIINKLENFILGKNKNDNERGRVLNNLVQSEKFKDTIWFNEIDNLRKVNKKDEITYVISENNHRIYFVIQNIRDFQNAEDSMKYFELQEIVDDTEIDYNNLKDIRISDSYITVVTSQAVYQKEIDSLYNIISDSKTIVIPIDDVNSIDLQDNYLLVGSEDATAKLFTSYPVHKKNKYHISSTFKGHKDAVLNVSFKRIKDKTYLLTSGEDGTINIWNASNFYSAVDSTQTWNNGNFIFFEDTEDLKEFPQMDLAHKDIVSGYAISNDSMYLVSTSNDNTAIIWRKKSSRSSVAKYDSIYTIKHHSNVNRADVKELKKNDYIMATASGKTVKLHKIVNDQVNEILSLIRHDHNIDNIEFASGKGEKVIYTKDEMGFVRKWNWENFENDLNEKTFGPAD